MYTVTTTFERLSTDTPYYIDSNPALRDAFNEFIIANGTLISYFDTSNETPLKQVSITIYSSELVYQEFINLFGAAFPTFFADRDAYCTSNNIQITRTEETI